VNRRLFLAAIANAAMAAIAAPASRPLLASPESGWDGYELSIRCDGKWKRIGAVHSVKIEVSGHRYPNMNGEWFARFEIEESRRCEFTVNAWLDH
jgi:hypothetical protein